MIGRLFMTAFIPGMFIGVIYLTMIMYWITGYTPIDLINTIIQPLQQITEALK